MPKDKHLQGVGKKEQRMYEHIVDEAKEDRRYGKRAEEVAVDLWTDGAWQEIARATSIGPNRLIRLARPVTTSKVRLRVTSPVCTALSDFGIFRQPQQPAGAKVP